MQRTQDQSADDAEFLNSHEHFIEVYDTGVPEEKLAKLFSQNCRYHFLSWSLTELDEVAKKMIDACKSISAHGTLLERFPESYLRVQLRREIRTDRHSYLGKSM